MESRLRNYTQSRFWFLKYSVSIQSQLKWHSYQSFAHQFWGLKALILKLWFGWEFCLEMRWAVLRETFGINECRIWVLCCSVLLFCSIQVKSHLLCFIWDCKQFSIRVTEYRNLVNYFTLKIISALCTLFWWRTRIKMI